MQSQCTHCLLCVFLGVVSLLNNIKRVNFENIQDPQTDIKPEMQDFRKDLACLRAEVGHKIRFTPPVWVRDYDEGSDEDHAYRPRDDFVDSLQSFADDAAILEQFSTDRLTHLVAPVAAQQRQRADTLTWLAAVYAPPSLSRTSRE